MRLPRALAPRTVVRAHCDLPCGIYDPAQARIVGRVLLRWWPRLSRVR